MSNNLSQTVILMIVRYRLCRREIVSSTFFTTADAIVTAFFRTQVINSVPNITSGPKIRNIISFIELTIYPSSVSVSTNGTINGIIICLPYLKILMYIGTQSARKRPIVKKLVFSWYQLRDKWPFYHTKHDFSAMFCSLLE